MKFQGKLPEVDHLQRAQLYLVGIKGVGMTALALMLQQLGLTVRGADSAESFVTEELLSKSGIEVDNFETAQLPPETNLIIYSGANGGRDNPLVQIAADQNIAVLSLAQAMGLLSLTKTTIGVCGVGGKSTTSALVSWILDQAGHDPSFAVGVGQIPNFQTSARWRQDSEYLVVEADEYVADPQADLTPRFLYLRPTHLICTALAYDHPDVYQSFGDTKQAFASLFALLPENGILVINGDDPALRQITSPLKNQIIKVGEQADNDVVLCWLPPQEGMGRVELTSIYLADSPLLLETTVPGIHNLQNAAYAAALCLALGVSPITIKTAVASFASVQRRFEFVGRTNNDVFCFDDYAHHPRELMAVAETLRTWFPNRQISIAFEPHTFSRTSALFDEFVAALSAMPGEVILLPIFASAREQDHSEVNSQQLVDALQSRGKSARLLSGRQNLLEYIEKLLANTIFITLGAGSIYKVYEQLDFTSIS